MNDLKERYIYAVVKHLPAHTQRDVEMELDELITDMTASQRPIEEVLTELGPPNELALKYCGEGRTALISGTYYLLYIQVLKIVLPIAASVAAVLSVLSSFRPGVELSFAAAMIAQPIASALGMAVQAFAAITIIFAVLEYAKFDLQEGDMLKDLPEAPERRERVSIGDAVFDMVVSAAFAVVMLTGLPIWFTGENLIPIYDVDVVRGMTGFVILWSVAGIFSAAFSIVEGRHTFRLAFVTLAANAVIAVCTFAIFGNADILNMEFLTELLPRVYDVGVPFLNVIVEQHNAFMVGIILLILVGEVIYNFAKAFQGR